MVPDLEQKVYFGKKGEKEMFLINNKTKYNTIIWNSFAHHDHEPRDQSLNRLFRSQIYFMTDTNKEQICFRILLLLSDENVNSDIVYYNCTEVHDTWTQ